MDKLFIYGGITVGSVIGAYLPVWLFSANPLGFFSIVCGVVGSLLGLWAGYVFTQNIGE